MAIKMYSLKQLIGLLLQVSFIKNNFELIGKDKLPDNLPVLRSSGNL